MGNNGVCHLLIVLTRIKYL